MTAVDVHCDVAGRLVPAPSSAWRWWRWLAALAVMAPGAGLAHSLLNAAEEDLAGSPPCVPMPRAA
jgi:hypothetical protein